MRYAWNWARTILLYACTLTAWIAKANHSDTWMTVALIGLTIICVTFALGRFAALEERTTPGFTVIE